MHRSFLCRPSAPSQARLSRFYFLQNSLLPPGKSVLSLCSEKGDLVQIQPQQVRCAGNPHWERSYGNTALRRCRGWGGAGRGCGAAGGAYGALRAERAPMTAGAQDSRGGLEGGERRSVGCSTGFSRQSTRFTSRAEISFLYVLSVAAFSDRCLPPQFCSCLKMVSCILVKNFQVRDFSEVP